MHEPVALAASVDPLYGSKEALGELIQLLGGECNKRALVKTVAVVVEDGDGTAVAAVFPVAMTALHKLGGPTTQGS